MQLRVQEKDSELKAERIQRLLERNLTAVVETADGSKQPIATRRQRMEVKSLIEPSEQLPSAGAAMPPQQVDLLRMADRKIEQLEQQAAGLLEEHGRATSQHVTLQTQLQRREDEIERLGRLLEGGRPPSSVFKDTEALNEERKLAQLSNQVEYLQQTNKALENELVATTGNNEELALKVEEMQAKNGTMVRELSNFDRLSRELQQEKLAARSEGERELRKERAAITRQKQALSEKLASSQSTSNEAVRLQGENTHLAATLSKAERVVEQLQTDLDRALHDNKLLGARAQKAVARERELSQRQSQTHRRAPAYNSAGADAASEHAPARVLAADLGPSEPAAPTSQARSIAELEEQVAVLEAANKSLQ